MAELDFRVDWGYQFLYSRRHYHPEYRWDGNITCRGGTVREVRQLSYPVFWWGVVETAKETPLPSHEWKSVTRRGIAGIRAIADCPDDAEFVLNTAQGEFRFSARQVRETGRIVFHVGPKYSNCDLIVTRTGYLWFRPAPLPLERVAEARDLQGAPHGNWQRMDAAWIAPGAEAAFELELPSPEESRGHWLFHLQAMAIGGSPDATRLNVQDYMPMELSCDGRSLAQLRYYMRYHDTEIQLLNDVWREIPFDALAPGRHRFQLANRHPELALLVNRVSFRPRVTRHLGVCAPAWALVGRETILRVDVLEPDTRLAVECDPGSFRVLSGLALDRPLAPGRHEIRVVPLAPLRDARLTIRDTTSGARAEVRLPDVFDLPSETPEVKVGFDMTTVPHDDCGEMDWLLDYTQRTQLGNLVIFRSFPPHIMPVRSQARWGRFCRDHGIHIQSVHSFENGVLAAAAGEFCHALGGHELSGVVYGADPDNVSRTMKEAAERYTAYIRERAQAVHRLGSKAAFGDASGGHRYSLLAGTDFLRAETMVPHTMTLLSQARGAAQALGSGEWGVHIAIQHCKQLYLESHLGWYYLSLAQPWMMGASFLYEEDSLFMMFKEERQCWDDALTKGKRDMTRDFFRFAQTHPRRGRPEISIALLQGRYEAPFNGFICGPEQDPSYSVWGRYGRSEPTWGHRQPEKACQVMDVLMPGASTHPLRQRYDRRRFYFSGAPFGDFDQAPIEATAEFLSRYKLLLLLGWNTMTGEDYQKLIAYVTAGGTLLAAVPHFSRHEGREFLQDMLDLNLHSDGDLRELCGARVLGLGERFSGKWRAICDLFSGASCPPLSRAPSASPDEDGPCHLADVRPEGASPVIVDSESGRPMLLEYALGRGRVYLMTTWAYPGHEDMADFSGAVVARLCERHMGACRVEDPARETFWTYWPMSDGCGRLMLLNTDWTTRGGARSVRVTTPGAQFPIEIRERQMRLITVLPFGALVQESPNPHVEIVAADAGSARLRLHGGGRELFHLFAPGRKADVRIDGSPAPLHYDASGAASFEVSWDRRTCRDAIIRTRDT